MNLRRFFSVGVILIIGLPVLGWGQSIQLADSLFEKGRSYDRSGNMKESEFYYREAYNIYRDFQDTASWLKAGKEYGSALVYRSKIDSAMKMYRKLLSVNHPANTVYNRGDIYNSMGWAMNRTGAPGRALKYFQHSLPLAEQSGDSLLIGVVYDNLGRAYARQGNYSKALEFSQKALPYFKGLGNQRSIAITLKNIGDAYKALSLNDRALEFYNQSLDIRKKIGSVYLLAVIYNQIGLIQRAMGNYDQALISNEKALEYSRQTGSPGTTSDILNNIGLLYKNLGIFSKALDYYKQSLSIKRDISSPQSFATTIHNIGKLYWELGKVNQAAQFYREALAIRKKHGNPYDIASSLETMTSLSLERGDYQQAEKFTDQIKAIGDSTKSYDILQDACRFLGRISAARGKEEEALQYFQKEYAYSKYLTPNNQLGALKRMAKQYYKMNSDSAVIYGERAIGIIERNRSKAGAISDLKSGYLQRHSDFYTEVASWTLTYNQDLSRAYKLIEQAKARSLSDELAQASQNIDQQLPEAVRIERSKKRNRIDSLYTILENTRKEEKRSEVNREIRQAELSYTAYENSLQQQFPDLKSLKSPESIRLWQAQSMTDEQTAVLEYAVAEDQLIIFLITQNKVRAEQLRLSKGKSLHKKLTNWVADYKSSILSNAPRSQLQSQSKKLYKTLIQPFEKDISSFRNLIIVPDGALAYLPFEAILHNGQYLVEKFHIKYEPSLTSLRLLKNQESLDSRQLLAVAGSNFSKSSVGGSRFRQNNLSALPSTLMEVDSIATRFQEVSILKDNEVSEQKFKEMLRKNRYRYIHLATHGIIDENNPSRSGLALSTRKEITASSKEDGILRSSEIFGLDIESDMVVLSACNTGLGKVVKGEGILGMQRSFFYAGASTVVVSLWNVYDRSTASFMNKFYDALMNSDGEESWTNSMLRWIGWDNSIPFGKKATAMRKAKLQMIKHPLFNHPVYWAPFIVVGR